MTTLTIDPMLMADLSATCNNLGYLDDASGKYQREPECLECVKDLIKYLRKDDENHEIRRALGETKVVLKDLIPIIKHHSGDEELLDVTLRLLVNLTTPALILYEEELPGERVSRRYYLEVVQYLQSYKEAFTDRVFWSALVDKLTALLAKDWENRMEDDRVMVERILVLVRNVLSVPANPAAEKRTDDDASVHDQVLWAMHLAGLDDIVLFIAQSDDEQHLCMHVLEVVSLMLREQDAKVLARSGAARSQQERQKDIQELEQIRKQELEAKQLQKRKLSHLRHTRFGGTFRVRNLTSISDKDLIYHRPLAQINELSFDQGKVPRKTPKNRQPLQDGELTRRSMLTIRLFLKQLCAELLAGAYNKLMYNVKDDLARAKAQAHDESYYLWAIKFFMEFNRHHHFRVDRVSETLSVSIFHYIQTQLESYLEMMAMEKRKFRVWSKRAHLALRAYQELLFTIQHMDASPEGATREASRVLKSNLFYMPEYRELLYVLLCQYNPVKMSRNFLTDLVETTHVFVKLLEKFSGGGRIIVKQKQKARRKGKPRSSEAAGAAAAPPNHEETWEGLADELSAALQGERPLPEDVRPFDAASEVPVEEQRAEAMRRIQNLLRSGEGVTALALLRAAREVWPEGDAFGTVDIESQDEFLALREIHFAQLPGGPEEEQPSNGQEQDAPAAETPAEDEQDEDDEEVVEERESEFDFQDFIKRFMSAKVLEPYCLLLRHFDTNTPEANHCLVKMLHRAAWDHKMPALLFQASLFRTFQRAMEDPSHYRNPAFKELIRLAKYILRAFFVTAQTNGKVFMELLFWKTAREAYELEHGYDSYQAASKATKLAWTEEEEDELSRVYEEMRNTENADPDRDLLDRVLDALICRERTRRQVAKKLKQLGLVQDTRQFTEVGRAQARAREWTGAEEEELSLLWATHRDAADPLTLVMEQLSVRRPKNRIREKLLQLGLAADRKQLLKKRGPGRRRPAHGPAGSDEEGVRRGSGTDDSDDGGGAAPQTPAPARTQKRRRRPVQKPAQRAPAASRARLVAGIKHYLQNESAAAAVLAWLQESLEEAAPLRREEPEEALPLVALDDVCATALLTPATQTLLALLGAQAPGDGEMFWRLPTHVAADSLERSAALLSDALSGRLLSEVEDDFEKENENPAVSSFSRSFLTDASSDEEGTPAGTGHRSSPQGQPESQPPRSPSQDVRSNLASPSVSTSTSQRRHRLTSDSDDDVTAATATSTTTTQRRRRVTSDSDDDVATALATSTTTSQRRHRVTSDSDDDVAAAPSATERGRVRSDTDSDSGERTQALSVSASVRQPRGTGAAASDTARDVTPGLAGRSDSEESLSGPRDRVRQRAVSSGDDSDAVGAQKRGLSSGEEARSELEGRVTSTGAPRKARRLIESDSE